jgi:NitT/TauT family transport system ATP-binding protein
VALDDVDLAIERGSFVAVLGPSGCGKSTFLRLVAGLERVGRGTLEVDLAAGGAGDAGGPRQADRTRPSARAPIGFVFQDAHLLPWRTVLENVVLPLELRGVPREEAEARAHACIADVELADSERRYPDELSGGMRMRVSIARALATDPALLLLDEPFAALDELTRQRLDERLRDLWAKKRMTIVFVTHSLSEAVFLAERALVMSRRPGRIVFDRSVDLPFERPGAMRTDVAFARETALLYEALERHGSPENARA